MDTIIPPTSRSLILSELTHNKLLRYSRMGNNEIYTVNSQDSPNTINEIARLREITFRNSGGGIGKSKDVDHFDLDGDGYSQLIIWEPNEQKILGGYRYRSFPQSLNVGAEYLATSTLYNLSKEFVDQYLPFTIDLGRAFIIPEYQASKNKQNVFILDNIWDGLGALINQNVKYFLGRIVIYPELQKDIRDLIIYFMDKHFNNNNLLNTKIPYVPKIKKSSSLGIIKGKDYNQDFLKLKKLANQYGETIPPLINAYMKLSPSLQSFGATIDSSFGNLYEICIMINVKDIYPKYLKRYQVNFKM